MVKVSDLRVDVLHAGKGHSAADASADDPLGEGEEPLRLARVALAHTHTPLERGRERWGGGKRSRLSLRGVVDVSLGEEGDRVARARVLRRDVLHAGPTGSGSTDLARR